MKKVVVMSVGGSIIIPDQVNFSFLNSFKKTIRKYYRTHKFVVVCGGGSIARKYISALESEGKSTRELSEAGIRATRMNAMFVMQFFGKEANDRLPMNMEEVRDNLRKNDVVVCGALRYAPHSTSDSTASKLANFLNSDFVNMTNVKGLFDKNPKKHREAKFIPHISWRDFEKMALAIKFKNGQNFVLDQSAAGLIRKNKISTFILGPDIKNFEKFLEGKKFVGTTIRD